jgi:hypothetical protein
MGQKPRLPTFHDPVSARRLQNVRAGRDTTASAMTTTSMIARQSPTGRARLILRWKIRRSRLAFPGRAAGGMPIPFAHVSLVATLKDLETRRLRALIDADEVALDALHAPEFVLINPSGGAWSKAKYLSGVLSGDINYRRFDAVSNIGVMADGSLAVFALSLGNRHARPRPRSRPARVLAHRLLPRYLSCPTYRTSFTFRAHYVSLVATHGSSKPDGGSGCAMYLTIGQTISLRRRDDPVHKPPCVVLVDTPTSGVSLVDHVLRSVHPSQVSNLPLGSDGIGAS